MTQSLQQSEAGELPLSGIRVIEFTHMVMGPTCGMILADLGAEVIKVEPPGGEKTRRLPGLGVGFFHAFNRNKKSVTIDIRSAAGCASAKDLIATSDVVLENFRPGLMSEVGLDYESLSAANPGLIYVSHKGFLPGPYEDRVALDEVVQNMAGLTYMTGPKGMPLRAGTSVNDIMGGMFGAIGVLAALRERERTGKGQEIQSALFENCCLLASQHMHQYQLTGEVPPPFPSRVSAWSVYDTFEVANDEQLFIGAVSDRQFLILGDSVDPAPPHLKIANKSGWAYGYLTDTAYIRDTQSGREFIISASIHVNANQTFNDDEYEYEELGVPFLAELGRALITSERPAGG